MLSSLFPKGHRGFTNLSVLGPIADSFDDWLESGGYTLQTRKRTMSELKHVNAELRRRGIKQIPNLTVAVLNDYWRSLVRKYSYRAATVRALERYLIANKQVAPQGPATAQSSASILINKYADFLHDVCGLAVPTISQRRYTAQCFLHHLDQEGIRLKRLQRSQIDTYITEAGKRLSRITLQRDISRLRGFLRYLVMVGRAPEGLAGQIDAPRLYRLEKLPRSVSWEMVRALLRSIDKSSAKGRRDYAMFLLMATYGLRSSEVVALTLDDLHWRQGSLRIHQAKTSSFLELPLTNEVSHALVKHLKRTPPRPPYRRIFRRMHAPIGMLRPTAINAALRFWVQKNGLAIPPHSSHCLRHSLAAHLLQKGTPLKTIGDILGHRSAASTSTYLRLATTDLREVPLPVPGRARRKGR